jgi:hypothetical protein
MASIRHLRSKWFPGRWRDHTDLWFALAFLFVAFVFDRDAIGGLTASAVSLAFYADWRFRGARARSIYGAIGRPLLIFVLVLAPITFAFTGGALLWVGEIGAAVLFLSPFIAAAVLFAILGLLSPRQPLTNDAHRQK